MWSSVAVYTTFVSTGMPVDAPVLAKRRAKITGHVVRLNNNVPAMAVLSQVNPPLGCIPNRHKRRHDTVASVVDLWRRAVRRRHGTGE